MLSDDPNFRPILESVDRQYPLLLLWVPLIPDSSVVGPLVLGAQISPIAGSMASEKTGWLLASPLEGSEGTWCGDDSSERKRRRAAATMKHLLLWLVPQNTTRDLRSGNYLPLRAIMPRRRPPI